MALTGLLKVLGVVLIIFFVIWGVAVVEPANRRWREQLLKKYSADIRFPIGRYLFGLEGGNRVADNVKCFVSPTDFVFVRITTPWSARVNEFETNGHGI